MGVFGINFILNSKRSDFLNLVLQARISLNSYKSSRDLIDNLQTCINHFFFGLGGEPLKGLKQKSEFQLHFKRLHTRIPCIHTHLTDQSAVDNEPSCLLSNLIEKYATMSTCSSVILAYSCHITWMCFLCFHLPLQ